MIGKHNISWIIDTGASNHMTGCLKLLHNMQKVSRFPVTLSDGCTDVATNEGSTKLKENLVLKSILYVPILTCNLIFMSQLIEESDCFVLFNKLLSVL